MKNIRHKVSAAITTVSVTALNVMTIHAEGLTFNEGAAKSLVETFFKPLTSFLLWFVPLAALAASIWVYIKWTGKDEAEQEQKPWSKLVVKIVTGAVVVEALSAIMKVFGL